jgi:hypothetical protein
VENKKLRVFALVLTLCLVACLALAFFLPDYRLFIALALIVVAIKAIFDVSSEFVLNRKTILVMVLSGLAATLVVLGGYVYFSLMK